MNKALKTIFIAIMALFIVLSAYVTVLVFTNIKPLMYLVQVWLGSMLAVIIAIAIYFIAKGRKAHKNSA